LKPGKDAAEASQPRAALRRRNLGPLYTGPMTLWFTVFFLVPVVIIVAYSFLRRGPYGGVEMEFTLDAYRSLADGIFVNVTLRTLRTAIVTTVITLLIALPCGYYMARSKRQNLLLLLIIIPFWTNFLIRVFAWMNILGRYGFLNETLRLLGIVDEPIQIMFTQGAVVLVLVYMYLPFAILPLFASIDKFDFSLLEAARDLGASKFSALTRVLLPNIRGGIMTAVLFTFIPVFGAYAIPLLVGGRESYMLGNMIADQLLSARNWPRASAISMVITLVTTAGVMFTLSMRRRDASRMAEARFGAEGGAR